MPGSKVTLFTMLLLTQDQIHDGTGITHPFSLFTPSSPFIVDGVWIVTVDGTIYSRPMAASLSASPYISNPGGLGIPCNVGVLLDVVRAGTPEWKVRVWSRSLDPIDSIGQPLSIRIGPISTLQGIFLDFIARPIYRLHHAQTPHIPSRYSLRTNLIWKDTGIKMSTKTTLMAAQRKWRSCGWSSLC